MIIVYLSGGCGLWEDGVVIVNVCLVLFRMNEVVKQYIVAMVTHCQYTIDGVDSFPSLPALIEVINGCG